MAEPTPDAIDEAIRRRAEQTQPGTSATPTKTPTPTARQAYLRSKSDSQLATMLKQGVVTEAELASYMPDRLPSIKDNPVSATEMKTNYANIPPAPPPDRDSWENPAMQAQNRSTISGDPFGQAAGTPPAPPPPVAGKSAPVTTSGSKGGSSGGGSSRSSSGGGSAGPVAIAEPAMPPPPPPPTPQEQFTQGGGVFQKPGLGINEGQQYERNDVQRLGDGMFYVVDPRGNGRVVSGPFESQAAASQANVYSMTGRPGISATSDFSSTANAVRQGLPQERVPGGMDLDQIIASTFTKGNQTGDIMGSANLPDGLGRFDVTRGNYSELGGLRDVTNGAGEVQSYTGQIPGNIAVGQGAPDANFLQQNGIPESVFAKMNPEQMRLMGHNIEMLRSQGNMPDLASLASQYDPKTSGQNLKIAGSVETPYEIALKKLMAQIDQPLEMMGLEQPQPPEFAQGGSMTVSEPSVIQGLLSGRPYGVMGASPEKVSNITPLGSEQDQRRAGGIESSIAQMLGGAQPMARGQRLYSSSADPAAGTRPNDPEEIRQAAMRSNPYSSGFKLDGSAYSRQEDGTWMGPGGPMPAGWVPPNMINETPGSSNHSYTTATGWEGVNQERVGNQRAPGITNAQAKQLPGWDTNFYGDTASYTLGGQVVTYKIGPDGKWYKDLEPAGGWEAPRNRVNELRGMRDLIGKFGPQQPQQPQAPAPAPLPDFLNRRGDNPKIFNEGGSLDTSFDWTPNSPKYNPNMPLDPSQVEFAGMYDQTLRDRMANNYEWGRYMDPMQLMHQMGRFNPPAINAEPQTFAGGGQFQTEPMGGVSGMGGGMGMGGGPGFAGNMMGAQAPAPAPMPSPMGQQMVGPTTPPVGMQPPAPANPMSNPLVLEQLAKGVRNRARLVLPQGII
jgi:hypothetical protein